MLSKPVTALALSALVSFASFTARSAVAAPNTSSESSVSASSQMQGSHHGKKDGKKGPAKKKGHLALHSAEPKESPKMAASLSTHLDLKRASDKTHVSASSKKTTIAATGKEVTIGGPKHGAAMKASASSHGTGPMAKAGRTPSRPGSVASKTATIEPSSDDHPVQVVDFHASGKVTPAIAEVGVKVAPVGTVGEKVAPGLMKVSAKVASARVKVAAPKAPCMHEAIEFVRGAETDRFPMTQCDGQSAPLAMERLSVLGRPESAARPVEVAALAGIKGPEIAPGVRRVDPGLVERLQIIADHFAKPGMPQRVSIVSGYRPGSIGSFHATGQALDFHLEGVPNEAVVDFCKSLENTGCGYYPNSSFVHVDVRAPGTGHVAWIDASGPGEPPHYVASWPPPPEPDVKVAEEDILMNPYIEQLPALPEVHVKREMRGEMRAPASINAPLRLKDWE